MAVTYEILQVLKPSHYIDAEKIEVIVPFYVVEKYRDVGIKPILEISVSDTPCKQEVLGKIKTLVERIMNFVPGLYFEDFKFRFVGGFSDFGYV